MHTLSTESDEYRARFKSYTRRLWHLMYLHYCTIHRRSIAKLRDPIDHHHIVLPMPIGNSIRQPIRQPSRQCIAAHIVHLL